MSPGLLLAAAVALAGYEPCPLQSLAKPKPTSLGGCSPGSAVVGGDAAGAECTDAGNGLRLCDCLLPGGDEMTVRVGLRQGTKWLSYRDIEALPVSRAHQFLSVDLDGDGQSELVVANQTRVSMGLAITSWVLLIWNGASPGTPPLEVWVEDFGPGSFIRLPGAQGCQLLQTEWGDAVDPRRGWGKYFRGRLLNYSVKGIQTASNRWFSRRLLYSFRRNEGGPLFWLQDEHTETCDVTTKPIDLKSTRTARVHWARRATCQTSADEMTTEDWDARSEDANGP